MGIKKTDYPRYDSFRADVLEVCKEALETYTDIKFTYQPIRKKARGGKINALKFIILRNDNYADPLSLADFIDIQSTQADKDDKKDDKKIEVEFASERLEFLAGACKNEFSEAEIKVLYNLVVKILPHKVGESAQGFQLRVYDHLTHRYDELNWRDGNKKIKNRFAYLKKRLEADIPIEN